MMKKNIVLFLLLLLSMTIQSVSSYLSVAASTETAPSAVQENQTSSEASIFSTLYSEEYGPANQEAYYLLDLVSMTKEQMEAEENKSWWQKGWGYVNGSALKNEMMGQIYEVVNMINNFWFQLNIGLSHFMLSVLNLAYEFNLVDELIEKAELIMQDITGISAARFQNEGLFGSFAGIIAALTAAYACYLYVWKRSVIESIGTFMKTVLSFAIALLFFSNYSAFLSGINQVTTEASQLVLSGSLNMNSSERSTEYVSEVTLREKMMSNIWNLFVDRPYLFMQYGTDEVEQVGRERIRELMEQPAGQDREDYVIKKEVKELGNNMMTYGSVMERAVFTPLYLLVNAISSVPIFLLALLLLIFQFWFIGIAAIAPFALLFAAVPGQFGVLKKYFVELSLPLILKMIVSFGAVVIFAMSELIYGVNNLAVEGTSEYIVICVLQFLLLMLLFFLRNRIKHIFSAGSKEIQALRAEVGSWKEAAVQPVKNTVQGSATVAGAITGAVLTGGTGTAAGAAIGNKAGQLLTGDGDISSLPSSITKVQQLARLQKVQAEKQVHAIKEEEKSAKQSVPFKELKKYHQKSSEEEDSVYVSEGLSIGKGIPVLTPPSKDKDAQVQDKEKSVQPELSSSSEGSEHDVPASEHDILESSRDSNSLPEQNQDELSKLPEFKPVNKSLEETSSQSSKQKPAPLVRKPVKLADPEKADRLQRADEESLFNSIPEQINEELPPDFQQNFVSDNLFSDAETKTFQRNPLNLQGREESSGSDDLTRNRETPPNYPPGSSELIITPEEGSINPEEMKHTEKEKPEKLKPLKAKEEKGEEDVPPPE